MEVVPATPTRREQILAAAAELFARHGFHGVGIDDIGSAVGISGPALYRHFRSKDAMLPWDIIDGGMKTSFFQTEFAKALREEWTLPPKRAQENAKLLPMLP